MSRIYSFSKGFTYETFAKIIYIYIYQVATIIHAKSCIKSQIQEAHQNQQKKHQHNAAEFCIYYF